MEYDVFLQAIKNEVAMLCDKEDEITLEKILKNNTLEMDALVIRRAKRPVSPTIYLEPFYSAYVGGAALKELADRILKLEQENPLPFEIRPDCLHQFYSVRDRIMMKLINTEQNEKLLSMAPSRSFWDLSVVYYIKLQDIDGGYASTLIRFAHMKMWEVTEEQLYEAAAENADRLQKPVLSDMRKTVGALFRDHPLSWEEMPAMYVVTNADRLFGAVCVLHREFLRAFAEKYGSFYILPCSVHELIFVPDTEAEPADLIRMVEEVNESCVAKEDFLSNHIYRYDAAKQSCCIVNNIKRHENIPDNLRF